MAPHLYFKKSYVNRGMGERLQRNLMGQLKGIDYTVGVNEKLCGYEMNFHTVWGVGQIYSQILRWNNTQRS